MNYRNCFKCMNEYSCEAPYLTFVLVVISLNERLHDMQVNESMFSGKDSYNNGYLSYIYKYDHLLPRNKIISF